MDFKLVAFMHISGMSWIGFARNDIHIWTCYETISNWAYHIKFFIRLDIKLSPSMSICHSDNWTILWDIAGSVITNFRGDDFLLVF
jgi:hypothetical protein